MHKRTTNTIITVVAVLMVIYQIATSVRYFVPPLEHLGVHLGFALILVYANTLIKSSKNFPLKLSFIILSIVFSAYMIINAGRLSLLAGSIFVPMLDLVIGGILILIILEALREMFGWTLTLVISIFLVYTFFGYLLPYPLKAYHFSFTEVLSRMGFGGLGSAGVYGSILRISANTIFLFILFGSVLGATRATRFFVQFGRLLGSKLSGGAGVAAVTTSALFGTVTGSTVANIATVGSFTIPMMKASGYRSEQAAGIEATASCGGQIMPPVLGAAAFLLADFTGIPYAKVMVMSIIPALLYFFSAFCYVQFQGAKANIGRVSEPPDYKEMLSTAHLFFIPLGVLIAALLMSFSPGICASAAIVLIVILAYANKQRPEISQIVNGFKKGAISGAEIAVTCAAIGLIVTSLSWTGLGIKLPQLVETLSGGNVLLALFITMIVAIILGMGLPTPAVYLMVALAAIPALVRMQISIPSAHMFAFYFGCISYLTPPVAVGSLVASQMAGASYMKTSLEATKIALSGFFIPFLMVFAPAILLMPQSGLVSAILAVTGSFVVVALAQIVVSSYYIRQVNSITRILCGFFALALFMAISLGWSGFVAAVMCLFVLFTIWQWRQRQLLRQKIGVAAVEK